MDLLSALLREMRLESAAYRRLELRAPWRIAFDQAGVRGVHVVVSGRCELLLDGAPPRLLETGDLVIAPRADPHELCAVGERRSRLIPASELAGAGEGGHLRAGGGGEETVIVCGAFVFHELDHPAIAGLPRTIVVAAGDGAPGWVTPYVDALIAEASEDGPGGELVMARLSDALVARALRFHFAQADEPGWLRGLQDRHVARALGALHEDLGCGWTLAALAGAAGLSRAAFAERFARLVGEPPMRYLLRHRMRRVMTLLGDERVTLARAAASVGYGSEAALSAAFKRYTGVAPGEYRRSHGNGDRGRRAGATMQ